MNNTIFYIKKLYILLLYAVITSCNIEEQQLIKKALEQSATNRTEISKALNHYKEGSPKAKAMIFIISNMIDKKSCDNEIMDFVKEELQKERDINKVWIKTLQNYPQQKMTYDLRKVKASYLIKNIDFSYNVWKKSTWHKEIDFIHYCNYILPYNILDEPIVEWRRKLYNKYYFLIKDCKTQKQAFLKVLSYFMEHFQISSEYVPYENDILLLEKLEKGDCKARTIFITYIMRALGICASFDYSPIWANCSNNSHSWVSMVTNNNKAFWGQCGTYIDGTFESVIYNLPKDYIYSVDSLKRISKIYRKTFKNNPIIYDKHAPTFLNSQNDVDVTEQYPNLTKLNIVKIGFSWCNKFYVCTYKQQEGWVPVGIAKRISYNKVDIGGLLNDCIIIIAIYKNGILTPISSPYKISHQLPPQEMKLISQKQQVLRLHRKYILSSRWINRWGKVIGTTIETSNLKMFNKNVDTIFTWNKLPSEETHVPIDNKINKNYLRIMPSELRYPIFAEIQILDDHDIEISPKEYCVYSVGEGLTGDTTVVKSLTDKDERTTFYKQFPYWIGIDIRKCKNKIAKLNFIYWNDLNRITKNHTYELFYYDNSWKSLGKKKAMSNYLIYDNAPVGCLFLLRDYTMGKEERIFEYKNNRQIWW